MHDSTMQHQKCLKYSVLQDGTETQFRVKPTTKFQKVFDAFYSKKVRLAVRRQRNTITPPTLLHCHLQGAAVGSYKFAYESTVRFLNGC